MAGTTVIKSGKKPKKVIFHWTNETVEELIDLIEENSFLWDIKNKDYHKKDKRKDALSMISDKLQVDEDEIKKKWNTLRTQYSQEKTKVIQSTNGELDDIYKSKWIWFNRMQFLWDIIGCKRSHPQSKEGDETDIHTQNDFEDNENNFLIPNEPESVSPAKKIRFSDRNDSIGHGDMMKMLKSATEILQNLQSAKSAKEDDEFDIFGKNVANELRHIKNAQVLLLAKHKINNIIFEAQYGDHDPQQEWQSG